MADNQAEVRQQYVDALKTVKDQRSQLSRETTEAAKLRDQLYYTNQSLESKKNSTATVLERNNEYKNVLSAQVSVLTANANEAPIGSNRKARLELEARDKAEELASVQKRSALLESQAKKAQDEFNAVNQEYLKYDNIIRDNNNKLTGLNNARAEIEAQIITIDRTNPGLSVQAPVTSPEPQLTQEQIDSGFKPVSQQPTTNELSPLVPSQAGTTGIVAQATAGDTEGAAAPAATESTVPQKTLTTADIISGAPVLQPSTAAQKIPPPDDSSSYTRDNRTVSAVEPIKVVDQTQTSNNPLNPSGIEITKNNILGTILASPVSAVASSVDAVRRSAVNQATRLTREQEDWRVRLQLAPSANYLYNVATKDDLLYPLKGTNGVIFPYTPVINSAYRANYDPADLTHVNYKQFFYRNSSIDEISIQAEFTAQDTTEANYMLAVIHFFRTVTKMFYGQDGKGGGPSAGTPPPLCYLSGYGQFQYSDHPLLISQFTYNLPNDVDYIRAGSTSQWAGQNISAYAPKPSAKSSGGGALAKITSFLRRSSNNLNKGGMSADPAWNSLSSPQATYVPTKIQLSLTCLPVVTRNDISNNFSVEQYATGKLYKGGIW